MPAVHPERLAEEVKQIQGLIRDPKKLRWRVMDIFEFYVAYPFNQLVALEAVGITEPGASGKFVMEGHTAPGGKCPCSTIGDAAGRGHTGSGVSMANYI